MDFLDIRKKAKERARAQAAGGAADPSSPAPAARTTPAARERSEAAPRERRAGKGRRPSAPAHAEPPGAEAPGAEAPGAEAPAGAELVALLQDLPPAGEPDGAAFPPTPEAPLDARFTTWRPGDGAPPFVPPPPALGPIAPPHEDDFRLIPTPGVIAPAKALPSAPARPAELRNPLEEFFYRPDEEAPELPQLAQATAPTQEPGPIAREEYLTFLLCGEEYAVAVRHVREVIKSPLVTDVPRAPHHILGVIMVRGEVVAVIDPRRRLALPESGRRGGKVVILDVGEGPCGLLVDDVANVVRLPPGAIEPRPQGIAVQGADCLGGIGREGDRIFTVLDLAGLLRRAAPRAADAPVGARRADAGA